MCVEFPTIGLISSFARTKILNYVYNTYLTLLRDTFKKKKTFRTVTKKWVIKSYDKIKFIYNTEFYLMTIIVLYLLLNSILLNINGRDFVIWINDMIYVIRRIIYFDFWNFWLCISWRVAFKIYSLKQGVINNLHQSNGRKRTRRTCYDIIYYTLSFYIDHEF